MRKRPRRQGARLFDAPILVRGLWQGGGALLILLGVFAIARRATRSDDVAHGRRRHAAAAGRYSSTGNGQAESTLSVTLPRKRCWQPLRPWEPMNTRSQ